MLDIVIRMRFGVRTFDDTHQTGPAKHAKRTAFDTHPWGRTPSVVIPERRSQVNFGFVQINLGMRTENATSHVSSRPLKLPTGMWEGWRPLWNTIHTTIHVKSRAQKVFGNSSATRLGRGKLRERRVDGVPWASEPGFEHVLTRSFPLHD